MKEVYIPITVIFMIIFQCGSYEYIPPPQTFKEADLVGIWEAKYGNDRIDTIEMRDDGTYQQRFQSRQLDYRYEGPRNKWYVKYSSSGKPKVYLEGMRYYEYSIDIGENGGKHPDGTPVSLVDIDENDEVIEMAEKVILRIKGDENHPRGIILWHLHFDLDASPAYFVLLPE